MQDAANEKIQVRLMGPPRIQMHGKPDEAVPINDDDEALELMALILLSILAAQPAEHGDAKRGRTYYVEREMLVQTLYPALYAESPKRARDKLSYVLKGLNAALAIRANTAAGTREREVLGVTLGHLNIDVQEVVNAARRPYDQACQAIVIALGAKRLLEGQGYSWLGRSDVQELRQTLDDCYLDALERRTESILVKMQGATRLEQFDQAETFRNEALPLLDSAGERLTATGRQSRAPRFAELRAKSSYLTPADESEETPVRSSDAPSARSISRYVTCFVGREAEQARLAARLSDERIVTITGMGGCGKTRLALQAALDHEESTGMQTWLVELASVTDPGFVAEAVAAAIDLPKQKNRTTMDALIGRFRTGRTLLILDNCEQVTISEDGRDGCAPLAATLTRFCPGLTILATSRQPLNIDGEYLLRLDPLRVPPVDLTALRPDDPVTAVTEYAAARLFIDRVRLHHELSLSPEHVAPIASICASLDGIPLALELAAARTRSLSITRVNELLTDRFQFLTDGRATALPRHKTLRAVIDWSYDLLTPEEQALLCRVSIFAGGWTLEAAQSVAADFEPDVLDLLTSLIDKSLVVFDPAIDPDRYRMLETVRQYAHDQLREQYLWSDARLRHRAYCLRLAEDAAPQLTGPVPCPWLDRLETEIENLRVALEWRADETALRLACALQRFWQIRSYFREGRRWLERDWEDAENLPIELRAKALTGAGSLAHSEAKFLESRHLLEKSLALWIQAGNDAGRAEVVYQLGVLTSLQSNYVDAAELYQESLDLSLESGNTVCAANARQELGRVKDLQMDYQSAREHYDAVLSFRRAQGDLFNLSGLFMYMGILATHENRLDEARDLLNESLALHSQLRNMRITAQVLGSLSEVARIEGDYGEARKYLGQSLELMQKVGDSYGVAISVCGVALIDHEQGDFDKAEIGFETGRAMLLALGNNLSAVGTLLNQASATGRQGKLERAIKLFREALTELRTFDAWQWIGGGIEDITHIEVEHHATIRSAILLGAADALLEKTSYCRTAIEKERLAKSHAALREALGDDAYASAYEAGRAMTNEEAFAFALEEGKE